MINAEFFRNKGIISGFKISGHAFYDDFGKDIVCAAVSSAVELTANTITEIFGFDAKVSAENNAIILKTAYSADDNLQKLYRGLLLHLENLLEEFKGTIKIKFTEV